jgi:hypothetical protein
MPKPRRRLNSLPKVRLEATRLYRMALEGELPADDAARLGRLLALIGRLLEAETEGVEGRLQAVEDELAGMVERRPRR